MSAHRTLEFCCFAVVSAFALGIVSADQARLRGTMDVATEAVSDQIAQAVVQPLLDFGRSQDEAFVDPPPGGSVAYSTGAD